MNRYTPTWSRRDSFVILENKKVDIEIYFSDFTQTLTKGERLCRSCSVTVPFELQLNNLSLYQPRPSTLLSHISVRSTCGLCETSHISIEAFDLNTRDNKHSHGGWFEQNKYSPPNSQFLCFFFQHHALNRKELRRKEVHPVHVKRAHGRTKVSCQHMKVIIIQLQKFWKHIEQKQTIKL